MAVTQYIGARYVPIFVGDWNNNRTYEPLSIVSYQGNSYTSKQFVPKQVAITNENYWALTGNYNAQVEQYRQDVANIENELKSKLNYYDNINDMLNDDNLTENVLCKTSGFYNKNDGGGAFYLVSNNGTVDNMTVFETTNGLFANLIIENVMTPEILGAKSNGNDDTEIFRKLFTFPNVMLGNKEYTLSDVIEINGSINLDGNNATIISNNETNVINYVFHFVNELVVSINTNVQIVENSNVIPIVNDSIKQGMFIKISNRDLESYNGYAKGLQGIVSEIKPGYITIDSYNSYDTFNAIKIDVYKKANVSIKNLEIKCKTNYQNAIVIENYSNIEVDNCIVEGKKGPRGIGCYGGNILIQNCIASWFNDELSIEDRTGYGIEVQGNNCTVFNCEVYNCKHCITSAGRFERTTNFYILDCLTSNDMDSSTNNMYQTIDAHGNVNNFKIVNTTIQLKNSSRTSAMINLRSKNNFLINTDFVVDSDYPQNIACAENCKNIFMNNVNALKCNITTNLTDVEIILKITNSILHFINLSIANVFIANSNLFQITCNEGKINNNTIGKNNTFNQTTFSRKVSTVNNSIISNNDIYMIEGETSLGNGIYSTGVNTIANGNIVRKRNTAGAISLPTDAINVNNLII